MSIPFANKNDVYLQRIIKFLNTKKAGLGQQFYMNQAFRAVNQALGRVIRHAHDYGQAYLLDERYCSYMQYLPQWLAPVVSQRFLEQEQNNELWYKSH